jgi:hypothetical protein
MASSHELNRELSESRKSRDYLDHMNTVQGKYGFNDLPFA